MLKQLTKLVLWLGLWSVSALSFNIFAVAIAQTPNPQSTRPVINNENDQRFIYALIKNALIAVNQGNLTGNYTVLRDLGNPAFRENNTSADLALIFADLRNSEIDFGAIVQFEPIFSQTPIITEQNIIRTTGYFPTTPAIEFDIIYQLVNNRYLIDSIAVNLKISS
jgi:hypothetical protein